jgi:hypothetical protein
MVTVKEEKWPPKLSFFAELSHHRVTIVTKFEAKKMKKKIMGKFYLSWRCDLFLPASPPSKMVN